MDWQPRGTESTESRHSELSRRLTALARQYVVGGRELGVDEIVLLNDAAQGSVPASRIGDLLDLLREIGASDEHGSEPSKRQRDALVVLGRRPRGFWSPAPGLAFRCETCGERTVMRQRRKFVKGIPWCRSPELLEGLSGRTVAPTAIEELEERGVPRGEGWRYTVADDGWVIRWLVCCATCMRLRFHRCAHEPIELDGEPGPRCRRIAEGALYCDEHATRTWRWRREQVASGLEPRDAARRAPDTYIPVSRRRDAVVIDLDRLSDDRPA